jgi:hypothetical protein
MRFFLLITLLVSLVTLPTLQAMSPLCCAQEKHTDMQHNNDLNDMEKMIDHSCCDKENTCQTDSCQCQLQNISYPPVAFMTHHFITVPTVITPLFIDLPLPFASPDRLDRPPILS